MKIGIIGAGQLGRMLALAGYPLAQQFLFLDTSADSPGGQVAPILTGAFDDPTSLQRLAAESDLVTYEFENVPVSALHAVSKTRPCLPPVEALRVSQDRLYEKELFTKLGIPTPPFRAIDSLEGLRAAVAEIGLPAVLKTRRLGYDGKGQAVLRKPADVETAWQALGGVPLILEGFVPFEREVSVIGARGLDGAFAAFDVCENEHENHILAVTRAPARMAPETAAQAFDICHKILDALDYVGVIAVEMFLVTETGADGVRREKVVVNEIAPRVHNSGHWTIEGAETSQFEQHVRAICGWPLGSAKIRGEVEMRNLIGDQADDWRQIAAEPGAALHLYGKAEARPGRKMGHVTRVILPPAR